MKDEFGAWLRGTTFLSPNYKLRRMPDVIAGALTAIAPTLFPAGALITTVASYAIYIAGTLWLLKQLAPKVPKPVSPDLSNRLQPDSPKQVIYGQTRVGGAITYIESDNNNSNLLQVICIAGHPVEEIGDIFLNDEKIAAANVGSGSSIGGQVNAANWKSNGNIYVNVYKGNGSNNTTALAGLYTRTDNTTEVNSTDFTGNNISFLYTDFEYNKNVFRDGIPTVTAVVKGRKIYDPRKDSTSAAYDASLGVSTHRKTNSSTWEYSNNPALCILDYITQDHGLNADYDEIDDQEWADEADLCDDTVTLADATTQSRYELNGSFTRDTAPQEVIPAMLSSCGGSLFYAQGKWVLRVGVYRTPITPVFDEDDLRGPMSIDTKTSRRDLFNSVTGQVSSPDEDWIGTDYPMITSSTFETEDGGERNTLELPLPFTTDMAMAQRLAKQTLYRAREQIIVKARFGLKAFEARVGDNIKLTNSRMGWSQKVFEVVEWKFSYSQGAAIEVDLTLKETSSSAYDWNAEETSFASNNTTVPRFNYAPQPTFDGTPTTEVIIQEDGTAVASAEVAWTVTDDAYVNDYVLEWKRDTETDYQSFLTTNLYYRIPNVQIGDDYDLRISSRNRLGIQSDISTTTVTITGDVTAPSAPTSASASGGYRSNFISWSNPSDNDFKETQVYVNTSNTTTGATLLGTTSATEFVHGGLAQNTTRYYFLKAVDFTGNVSGFSSGTSATTLPDPATGATGADGADGADGDTGDTVVSGRVYYQTIQSSAPSTPSATSYNVSTASFSGLTSGWALTQPQIDITDTSIQEWSSAFTVTIDGVTSAQTIVFTTPTGAIQVADDIESDNYVAGTSGWKIERDTGFAEFGSAAIRDTLTVGQIPDLTSAKITDFDTQLDTRSKVFTQLSTSTPTANAVGDLWYQTDTRVYYRWSGSAWTEVTLTADSIVAGTLDANVVTVTNLNATNITAGTLEADHIKLTGSQLENSGGSLIISDGGVDTVTVASRAITNTTIFSNSSLTLTSSGDTSLGSFTISEDTTLVIIQGSANCYGSGTGTTYSLSLKVDGSATALFLNSVNDDYATYDDLRFPIQILDRRSYDSGSHTIALGAVISSGSSIKLNSLDVIITELKR